MKYVWNYVLISWLLIKFSVLSFIPAQSNQNEETFPISSSSIQLACDNGLRVNNIDVAIRRSSTTCLPIIPECTLPNEAIETIKEKCNKQISCDVDIRNITSHISCLQEYGYFNVWYTCKSIVDYSCDFESTLCNWSFVHEKYRFRWTHGLRWLNQLPYFDHTSASRDGKYVYIYTQFYGSVEGDIANLESGDITATEQQCLSFWYYMTNSRDSVHVFQNEDNLFNLTFNYEEQIWNHIQVPLEKKLHDSFKLVFKVTRGNSNDGSYGAIVIDDILIKNQNCNSSILFCDFDNNSCDWKTDGQNLVWQKQQGEPEFTNSGPSTDHTSTSESGDYMYLGSEADDFPDGERIASFEFHNVELDVPGNYCLTFWYHMYISQYGTEELNVKLNDEIVWTEYGKPDNRWEKGTINIHSTNKIYIKFMGILGSSSLNDIAIDDILLTYGTCDGLIHHEEACVHSDIRMPKETSCPKDYLDFQNPILSFDPEKDACYDIYDQIKTRLRNDCASVHASQKCLIDLSTDISSQPECFQLYEFRIQHTCEEEETSTAPLYITSGDSSAEEETSTAPLYITSGDSSADVITVYAVVVSTLVIIILAVLVFTVIVCHFKKRVKSSKLCDIPQHISVREMIDSSGYSIINYNKMTGINISGMDKTRLEANVTNRQPEDIRIAIKQEDTIGNKHESLSTNRNPSEHAYESDPIHTNQYQTLTKQRESDKHFYESTESPQAQDNKTLTGKKDDICHKYELLSINRNSVEHAYDSDVLHINQYQTATKQRESDKHVYESTEPVQKQNIQTLIKQEDDICKKYESLSTNRNSVEHTYESDSIHTNQYQTLTKQRESDEHKYESTDHASQQDIKTLIEPGDNLCNKYESLSSNRNSNEHIYESDSIHTNQNESLTKQQKYDKHIYESTGHPLRLPLD